MKLRNCQSIPIASVPLLSMEAWHSHIVTSVAAPGGRLWALLGIPASRLGGRSGTFRLIAVCGNDCIGEVEIIATDIDKQRYPALTPDCPQAHVFERELYEQWRIIPDNHPWLKPVRFQKPFVESPIQTPFVGDCDYFCVEGEEIHEVAVGPVHAGIIEPGHFRFQCHGEHVQHLEISLGYQHRGIEARLAGPVSVRTVHYMETLAGDTTVGHTLAYSMLYEALAGYTVPPRAQVIRAILLELERCANHTGDLGALAGDVAFLPTLSYCGRLRGDFLNLTALICGNRFGRNAIRPGGVQFDIDTQCRDQLWRTLEATLRDTKGAVDLLWESTSVMKRFEGTGTVDMKTCRDLGIVGVAARASGIATDIRRDYPVGVYTELGVQAVTELSGDVLARARVRWREIEQAGKIICTLLERCCADGPVYECPRPMRSGHIAVALVEAWRGPVCHCAITDTNGGFIWYKPIDPSVRNWSALAMALRGQEISDFPLCNKSFNLSYCGVDL